MIYKAREVLLPPVLLCLTCPCCVPAQPSDGPYSGSCSRLHPPYSYTLANKKVTWRTWVCYFPACWYVSKRALKMQSQKLSKHVSLNWMVIHSQGHWACFPKQILKDFPALGWDFIPHTSDKKMWNLLYMCYTYQAVKYN